MIYNPRTMENVAAVENAFETPAAHLGVEVTTRHVFDENGIEEAIRTAAQADNSALVVVPDGSTAMRRDVTLRLTRENRLPAIYGFAFYPRQGGLISYGVNSPELT